MTLGTIGKSTYSKSVSALISRIYDNTSVGDSVYEQAIRYFLQAEEQQAEKTELEHIKPSLEKLKKTSKLQK